jgi:hypothetical protein
VAVRFDANGDYLRRTTGTIAASGANLSGCCWFKRKGDTNAFTTICYVHVITGSELEIFIELDTSGDVLHFYEDPPIESDIPGLTVSNDIWYFVAWSRSNTSRTLYYGTEAGGTLTKGTNADSRTVTQTVGEIYIGNDIYSEFLNGEVAYVRLWDAVLSDADMDAEWRSTTPVRSSNLRGDWRLASAATATTDSGPNGLTLTVGGTLADGGADPTPPSLASIPISAASSTWPFPRPPMRVA